MRANSLLFSQGLHRSQSVSTVISIVPFPIDEYKPGLIPGQFHIDPCLDGRPVCQALGDSFFYVYIDAERGQLRVPAPSQTVAQSIVFDYNTAQLEANIDCHPGLFWAPGEWTQERVEKELADELDYIKSCQTAWFVELVKRADDDWEKTRQHYAISDVQRHALRTIDPENSQNRPWILVPKVDKESMAGVGEVATQLCPACGSDIPVSVVLCKYCHCVLDPAKYSAMTFATTKSIPPVPGLDLSKFGKP